MKAQQANLSPPLEIGIEARRQVKKYLSLDVSG